MEINVQKSNEFFKTSKKNLFQYLPTIIHHLGHFHSNISRIVTENSTQIVPRIDLMLESLTALNLIAI